MELKIVSGIRGKVNELPSGHNTKVFIDGREIGTSINILRFETTADSVANWTIVFKNDSRLLTKIRIMKYRIMRWFI